MKDLEPATGDVSSESRPKKPRNAFTELMQRKTPTKATSRPHVYSRITTNTPDDMRDIRNGLGAYIKDPTAHGENVVRYDNDWVLIRDKYPKSLVHLLLLTRNPSIYSLAPQAACEDLVFLAKLRVKAEECIQVAASELSRLVSPHSASCQERRLAMTSSVPSDILPPGRDFTKEIMVGFHAGPSMNHLHLHVISRDRFSPYMKHHKHYNSFNNDFFLQLDQFPYADEDVRRTTKYQRSMLEADLTCWRCGRNFGAYNKSVNMVNLKKHLQEEFLEWRRE